MKQLKDYLHLYLGCNGIYNRLIYPKSQYTTELTVDILEPVLKSGEFTFKPILRPLSDITYEELDVFHSLWKGKAQPKFTNAFNADQFSYLLSKHFDLFGLIDVGLALDKTKQL